MATNGYDPTLHEYCSECHHGIYAHLSDGSRQCRVRRCRCDGFWNYAVRPAERAGEGSSNV